MKSRVKSYSKKEVEWMCDEVSQEVEKCVNSNGAVFLIALMRHTGWGKKRLSSFIETLNNTMEEYHRHSIDGVFDYMIRDELSELDINIDELFPEIIPFKRQLKKSQKEREVNVDYSTAKAMHEELIAVNNMMSRKNKEENL